jgi:L-threonylcarbamoyladenylate synthase
MTRILAATPEAIREAASVLAGGGLVAFPTETVYGLGADAADAHAVARIFAAKGRPRFNPLIVHIADRDAVSQLALVPERAATPIARLWPGPLTLVLRRRPDCPVAELASAGLDTLAVRMPDHAVAQSLIRAAGRPLVAPSANRSSRISPTRAEHVVRSLGDAVDIVLDGGACRVGVESTVLDMTTDPPTLLRPGGLPVEALESLLGPIARAESGSAIRAPGMLRRHYAPACPLRLNASRVAPGEALLDFGASGLAADATLNLSPAGDPVEAAANLFHHLHELEALRPTVIAVAPIPERGLGRAINDRLRRAAEPAEPLE